MIESRKARREFKAVSEQYVLEVLSFDVRLTAGVNMTPGLTDFFTTADTRIYGTEMHLEIRTSTLEPKRFKGETCILGMRTGYRDERWSTLCVGDVYAKDDDGSLRYFERGRDPATTVEVPLSIGYINSTQSHGTRYAHVSMPVEVIQEFRTALSLGQAPRIFMDVRRKGVDRWIESVAYSTPGLFEF